MGRTAQITNSGSRQKFSLLSFSLIVFLLCMAFEWSAQANDLQQLQKARQQFSKAQLKSAVKSYGKINKSSEYWLEALEEQAHSYGRLGQYNKAVANLKTVLAPQFTGLVGPEPYFVMGLTQLKICDYTGALKTSKSFKNTMRSRIFALEEISKNPAKSKAIYDRALKAKALNFDQLGQEAKAMPRFLHRDKQAKAASQKSFNRFYKRIKTLAKKELKEINKMISKMQIIETEVIQKVNLLAHDNQRKKQGDLAKGKNELVFPGDNEIWFDELGQFKAQVEKCPTLKQRASL